MPQVYLIKDRSGEVIEVPEGENSVGRGPLLKVTDKRVSRNHALLRLEKDKLKLCPKHRNPCFYKASGKDIFSVLPKDVWKELHNGDFISLLPDDLVFRVVEESPADLEKTVQPEPKKGSVPADTGTRDIMDDIFEPMEITPKAEEKQTLVLEDVMHKSSDPDAKKQDSSTVTMRAVDHSVTTQESSTGASSAVKIDNAETSAPGKDSSAGKLVSKASSVGKVRTLPAWLSELSSGNKPPAKKRKAPSKTASKNGEEESHPPPPKKAAKRDTTEDKRPPETKKRTTPSPSVTTTAKKEGMKDGKKLPQCPVNPIQEHKDEAKTLKAVGAGVAKPKPDTSATRPSPSVTTTASLAKKEDGKKLPQCPYGSTCYRKNPIHFQEYSHDFSATPDDTNSGGDSDDDDKPVCPYGTACYRKNPEHRKEYRHTGPPAVGSAVGTRHSDRTTKGKKPSLLAGDSDDDGEANTYDYTDSFIDDQNVGDSSSSYGGDSEDSDWAPPDQNSEDVKELVAEATSFISNKKMRKPT